MLKTKILLTVLLVSLSVILLFENALSEEIKSQSESKKEIKPDLTAEIINDKGKIIGKVNSLLCLMEVFL